MGTDTELDSAQAEVTVACAALRNPAEPGILEDPRTRSALLGAIRRGPDPARVRRAGSVGRGDRQPAHRRRFGSASTVALLRETLTISATDARARVNTAKMVLPQLQPSGSRRGPGAAGARCRAGRRVDRRRTDPDHRRHHQGLPGDADPGMLDEAEEGPRPGRHGHRTETLRRVREIRRRRPWTWTANPTRTPPTGSN